MSIRVDQVHSTHIQTQQPGLEEAKVPRLDLETLTSFETVQGEGAELASGLLVLGQDTADAFAQAFADLSPSSVAALSVATKTMVSALREMDAAGSDAAAKEVAGGKLDAARADVLNVTDSQFTDLFSRGRVADDAKINAAATALASTEEGIRNLAKELQRKQALAREMREERAELRDIINDDTWPQEFSYTKVTTDAAGNTVIEPAKAVLENKKDAETLLENMEGYKDTIGGLNELMTQDLQQLFQDQQRITQLMTEMLNSNKERDRNMAGNLKA